MHCDDYTADNGDINDNRVYLRGSCYILLYSTHLFVNDGKAKFIASENVFYDATRSLCGF